MTDTPPSWYQRRRERAARGLSNSEKCARCGFARINVVHEQDPEHTPEGMDYYRDFLDQLHPFEPTGVYVR